MAADIQATVAALQAQLRSLKCPLQLDGSAAAAGSPAPYLQALSWLLLHFSKHVALLVTQQGLQLRGASDLRFAEGALRFARDALALRPALSAAQLLADGQFARAKAALVLDVARACKERHNAAARQERLAALKACHAEKRLYAAPWQTSKRGA
ncbi:centrosomal of 44 kDa [Chlorella sorokiniana]|uniref:Centrosomal protein of 44 kDa n=1 Tax=Chlorella sorokiniana TaxID=3076 RepID=A0A2P6TF28_CHLSO|nr:centrosomal of 44 kDa [Chlorella sorokiniana]|eukprot:PRW32571.1 centrosomal of 44 kDa [Chlorella sorokiniana]